MMWCCTIFILGLACVINGQKHLHQNDDNATVEQSQRFPPHSPRMSPTRLSTSPRPDTSPQHNPGTEITIDASQHGALEKNTKCVPQLNVTFLPNESGNILQQKIISVIQESLVQYLPMDMPARQVIIGELNKGIVPIAQRVVYRNNKYIVLPPKVPGHLELLDFNGNTIRKPQLWQDMVTKGRKASFAMKYSDIVYTTVISQVSHNENCFCSCRLNDKWSSILKSPKMQGKNMKTAKKQPKQVEINEIKVSNMIGALENIEIENKNRRMLVQSNDKIPQINLPPNNVVNKSDINLVKVKGENEIPKINWIKDNPVNILPVKVHTVSNDNNTSITTQIPPKNDLPPNNVDTNVTVLQLKRYEVLTHDNIKPKINLAIDKNVTISPLNEDTVGNNSNASTKNINRTKRNISVLLFKEIIDNQLPLKGNLSLSDGNTNETVLQLEKYEKETNKNTTPKIDVSIDKNVTTLPLKVHTVGEDVSVSMNTNNSLHSNVTVLLSKEMNNNQMTSKVNLPPNVTTLPLKVHTVGEDVSVSINTNNSLHSNVTVLLPNEMNNNQMTSEVNLPPNDVNTNATVLRLGQEETNINTTPKIDVAIDKNVTTLPLQAHTVGNDDNVSINTNNSSSGNVLVL